MISKDNLLYLINEVIKYPYMDINEDKFTLKFQEEDEDHLLLLLCLFTTKKYIIQHTEELFDKMYENYFRNVMNPTGSLNKYRILKDAIIDIYFEVTAKYDYADNKVSLVIPEILDKIGTTLDNKTACSIISAFINSLFEYELHYLLQDIQKVKDLSSFASRELNCNRYSDFIFQAFYATQISDVLSVEQMSFLFEHAKKFESYSGKKRNNLSVSTDFDYIEPDIDLDIDDDFTIEDLKLVDAPSNTQTQTNVNTQTQANTNINTSTHNWNYNHYSNDKLKKTIEFHGYFMNTKDYIIGKNSLAHALINWKLGKSYDEIYNKLADAIEENLNDPDYVEIGSATSFKDYYEMLQLVDSFTNIDLFIKDLRLGIISHNYPKWLILRVISRIFNVSIDIFYENGKYEDINNTNNNDDVKNIGILETNKDYYVALTINLV
jgi:hypothetical protein